MSDNQKQATGNRLVRDNVLVIERYNVELGDDESRRLRTENPEGFYRKLIEQSGAKVNRLDVLKQEQFSELERLVGPANSPRRMRDTTFHVVYPETSGWICCCSD